jgi:hypothetical protein
MHISSLIEDITAKSIYTSLISSIEPNGFTEGFFEKKNVIDM